MANERYVETPRGFTQFVRLENGSVRVELVWNPGFGDRLDLAHASAQEFVDNEVLRLSNKYAPKVTSMLIKSGVLGTEVGSGEVAWIAPYARYQYNLEDRENSQNINPNFNPGEPKWFERAMAIHYDAILAGVEERLARGVA